MSFCGDWSALKDWGKYQEATTLFCRSWKCPHCGPNRKRDLKRTARNGKPRSFLTLTVNPSVGDSPTHRAQLLSDAFKLLVKRARRKWDSQPIEYLAVFEATKLGEPHLHILLRAPYLPQKWISEVMDELISAPVVDIRGVKSTAHAAYYVAKYVAKGNKLFGSMKRYWQSKNFDPSKREERRNNPERYTGWTISKYPLAEIIEAVASLGWIIQTFGDYRFQYIEPRCGPAAEESS